MENIDTFDNTFEKLENSFEIDCHESCFILAVYNTSRFLYWIFNRINLIEDITKRKKFLKMYHKSYDYVRNIQINICIKRNLTKEDIQKKMEDYLDIEIENFDVLINNKQ